MDEQHSLMVAQFCEATGQDEMKAVQYLDRFDWNLEPAVQQSLEDLDAPADEYEAGSRPNDEPLGGISNPTIGNVASSSSRAAPPPKQKQKKKFSSFKDLADNGSDGHSHGDDDDSDKEQEYFAGGDKSGLAVQDPGQGSKDHIKRILETARRNGPPPREHEQPQQSAFRGAGMTLGGDDTPSQVIADPNAHQPPTLPMAERTLHLWSDGFSVDDGPLFRYDDPANARTLEMINRGSAPLDLMNVENGQAVDVKLEQHQNEKYVQPTKKWKPFGGSGQRLGAPTPDAAGSASTPAASAAPATAAAPAAAASASAAAGTGVEVDEAQPTVTLQIRLADGTRLPTRFNTSHTIDDVYAFVGRASAASAGRAYSLATTFPTKELEDKAQAIGDLPELKRGGVVVQKWS